MKVVELTLEYNGRGWFCRWHSEAEAHALGVGPRGANRVVLGPADAPLDLESAEDLRQALYDHADIIVEGLVNDIIGKRQGPDPSLFDSLCGRPLAT